MQNIARYSFVILCHYPKIIEPRNSWDSMWWPFLCLRSVGTSENTKLWRRAGWHPTSTWETHELDATNKTPKFDVIWGGWHNMTTNWFMTVRWTFWPLGIYIYIHINIYLAIYPFISVTAATATEWHLSWLSARNSTGESADRCSRLLLEPRTVPGRSHSFFSCRNLQNAGEWIEEWGDWHRLTIWGFP